MQAYLEQQLRWPWDGRHCRCEIQRLLVAAGHRLLCHQEHVRCLELHLQSEFLMYGNVCVSWHGASVARALQPTVKAREPACLSTPLTRRICN